MAFDSANMALIIWDELDDAYSHEELAANWELIDLHDHSPGKGVQIGTGGIKDLAITKAKMAPGAVDADIIPPGAITSPLLGDDVVTAPKVHPDLWAAMLPLGTILPWYRPANAEVAVPAGWVECLGGSLPASEHDFPTSGAAIDVPDLRDKFLYGAMHDGPTERQSGGQNNRTWDHTHNIPDHTHNIDQHRHSLPDHSHSVQAHAHGIGADGAHRHTMAGGNTFHQRPYGRYNDTTDKVMTAYVTNVGSGSGDDVGMNMDNAGGHSHGGATGAAGGATNPAGAGTTGPADPSTTSGPSVHTTTGAQQGVGGDIRPAYFGVLFIMKVRKRTA